MRRRLFVASWILIFLLTSLFAAGAAQEPDWECDELSDYVTRVRDLAPPAEELDVLFADGVDSSTMRPSQLRGYSDLLDAFASDLESIPEDEIPLAAHEYHEAMIDILSVASMLFVSMASGGLFAALPYGDAIDEATERVDQAAALGQERCGEQWIGLDGVTEGEAVTPTPEPSPVSFTLRIVAQEAFAEDGDGTCYGTLDEADVTSGATVALVDYRDGTPLIEAELPDGTLLTNPLGARCVWEVEIEDVAPIVFYRVLIDGADVGTAAYGPESSFPDVTVVIDQ